MPIRTRFVLAAYYADSGKSAGYFTERGTLTFTLARADWMVSKESAEAELKRLQLETRVGWKDYIWCVEEIDPQHLVDADPSRPDIVIDETPKPFTPRPSRVDRAPSRSVKSEVPTAVEPKPVAVGTVTVTPPPAATSATTEEITMAVAAPPIRITPTKSQAPKGKIRPTKPAPKHGGRMNDRIARQVGVKLGIVPAPGTKAKKNNVAALSVVPPADERVTSKTKPKTKGPAKIHTTRGPGRPSKVKSVKTRYKAPVRDTAEKKVGTRKTKGHVDEAQIGSKGHVITRDGQTRFKAFPCLCGCGGKCEKYFVAGHVNRFRGALMRIEEGVAQPKEVLSAELVKKLGPWKPVKGGGLRPAISDYRRLRPEIR